MDYLDLYSDKCLRCQHLVEGGAKKYKACFHDRNPNCPASEVRIVITGQAIRLAAELKKARSRKDIRRESEILAFVANKGQAFEQKFLEAVNEPFRST